MGLVYTLSITSFSKNKINSDVKTYNLKKQILSKVSEKNVLIELVILEDKTLLKVNGDVLEENFELPKESEFYTYLQNDDEKKDFGYEYIENYSHKIKFKYRIYPNNASTQTIMKLDEKYYTYFTYFEDIQSFDELDEAKEYLLKPSLKDEMSKS